MQRDHQLGARLLLPDINGAIAQIRPAHRGNVTHALAGKQ